MTSLAFVQPIIPDGYLIYKPPRQVSICKGCYGKIVFFEVIKQGSGQVLPTWAANVTDGKRHFCPDYNSKAKGSTVSSDSALQSCLESPLTRPFEANSKINYDQKVEDAINRAEELLKALKSIRNSKVNKSMEGNVD